MNKTFLFLMATILPSIAFAQLKVSSAGRVSIGTNTTSYHPLTVVSTSSNEYAAVIRGYKHTMRLFTENEPSVTSSDLGYGIYLNNTFTTSNSSFGIRSQTHNSSTDSSAKAYGVYGSARSSNSGIAIGVLGTHATSTGLGAGIFGSANGSETGIDGLYAGYFYGNMKVTGTIDGTLVSSSDARLKEDVQPLGDNAMNRGVGVLQILESLNPVSFKYKQLEEKKEALPTGDGEDAVEEEELPNPVMEKEHFGLIAQELQEVYPNLVYEKDNGYLAVNYTELVPVLMQAIKELNAKVEQLEAGKASHSPLLREGGGRGGSETASAAAIDFANTASMDQNVPNPFTEKTDIAIYLPESVKAATLYIYDLSGKQLEQHAVEGRGDTVMTIHAERMDAGMYVYSLIADGKVVTTRKMIVVK